MRRLFAELDARDLRYAVRLLRKAPWFTATALAILALCLGATLTIFAVASVGHGFSRASMAPLKRCPTYVARTE